nr:MAG TPA: hypothetical protein [Caudoviricetes sp.]
MASRGSFCVSKLVSKLRKSQQVQQTRTAPSVSKLY